MESYFRKQNEMERLKDKLFNGISFEIIGENHTEEYGTEKYFLNLRITNHNEKKKKIQIDLKYISTKNGFKRAYAYEPSTFGYPWNGIIPDKTFVDLKIEFRDYITSACDGDRIELEVNNGKMASLQLIKESGEWMVMDSIERSTYNRNLKKKIEHYESIEEKLGILLQNFSVKVVEEDALKLFFEVIASNGEVNKESFAIEIAVYDLENNIVFTSSIRKDEDEFTGFEVFSFNNIKLDITVDEIGKIRIYPIR